MDENQAYRQYGKDSMAHKVVNHQREYVTKAGVHTNAVENAWSLLTEPWSDRSTTSA